MQIHLVTGGAGFLGSHLIDRLMEAGDEVILGETDLQIREERMPCLDQLCPHLDTSH